jgi:hypothetical protein
MTATTIKKLTIVPAGAKVKLVFNTRTCGRCGGTGTYFVSLSGGASPRMCYGCNGRGRLMAPATQKNRTAFLAWCAEAKPTRQQWVDVLNAGTFGRAFTLSLSEA